MNNSFERLVEGMADALRQQVIPNIIDEFARGQAYGVIFMLNSIRLRASWSTDFLREQLAAQQSLVEALANVAGLPAEVRLPARPTLPDALPSGAAALEALRDEGDRAVCCLIDWLGTHGSTQPAGAARDADAAVAAYMRRQIRFELNTSARPMFAEISLGQEATKQEAQ
jgi:hypothetical protein